MYINGLIWTFGHVLLFLMGLMSFIWSVKEADTWPEGLSTLLLAALLIALAIT